MNGYRDTLRASARGLGFVALVLFVGAALAVAEPRFVSTPSLNGIARHMAANGMAALGLAILIRLLLATPRLRTAFAEQMAHVPLIGPWLIEAEVGRWASTMSVLLRGRVELTRALGLAWQAMRFGFLRVRMQEVSKSVKAGLSLSEALRTHS